MAMRRSSTASSSIMENTVMIPVRPVKVQQRTSGGCWRTLQGLTDFAVVHSYLDTATKWASTNFMPYNNFPQCVPRYRTSPRKPTDETLPGRRRLRVRVHKASVRASLPNKRTERVPGQEGQSQQQI
jgi:hypothetical protein